MTFEELRIAKADDFPELAEGKRVSWTVEYGKVVKPISDPKGTVIRSIKEEIERSKAFLDGLKKAKDKCPDCLVKPKVTAQSKGIAAYKGVFSSLDAARSSDKIICLTPAEDGRVYEMRTTKYMAFMGIDWQVENDNPVVCCERFDLDFCLMRHPMLWANSLDSRSGLLRQCACHQTERPYTYEGSLDEAHDRVWAEAENLWKSFKARHKDRVYKQHCYYDRTAKEWHILFNPITCADNYGRACRYCSILDKELDTRRGNVFYDVKETRIIKGDWLFPDKEVTTVHKGYKVLDRTVSLTLCDAIVRYAKHHVIDRFLLNHHHELYFDKSLRYELINFRAQRQNTRDIMQDLADTAAGIEVVHQADAEKFRKEQKRARKEARLTQRVRSLEKLILTGNLDDLTYSQKNGLKKHLSEERIAELMAQRRDKVEQVQTSLFA